MKRSRAFWVAVILTVALAPVMFHPSVYWRVLGGGQSFYRGRPTSYWSCEIRQYDAAYQDVQSWRGPTPVERVLEDLGYLHLFDPKQPPRVLSGDPAAVPVLIELLGDGDPLVRGRAVEALGESPQTPQQAVPAIVEMLEWEKDPSVRLLAVWALGEFGPDARVAIPTLTKEYQKDEEDRRFWEGVIRALRKIQPEAAAEERVP